MQQEQLQTFADKVDYLENYLLSSDNFNKEQLKLLKHKLSHFKSDLKKRWLKANRIHHKFITANATWLQGTFEIPIVSLLQSRAGRPSKPFDELSNRNKRKRTHELRTTVSEQVLVHAAKTSLETSGHRNASRLLSEIIRSPKRAKKYKQAYSKCLQASDTQLSSLKALSMFVEADLSRKQYEIIRNTNKKYYPCYSLIQKEKINCYPPKSSITVTETIAEVNLQDLLNHTVTRLLTYLKEILSHLTEEELSALNLIYKWGCDGSQQSQFKQKMQNEDYTDSNIFQSCLVPLQLKCRSKIVWQNPTPSSPRYCRPIRIRFAKESTDLTNEEIEYMLSKIEQLENSQFINDGLSINVKHTLTLTMVDAKVCNAATQTSSTMRCYICGATSKQFNNLNNKMPINIESLDFGLSILHARIRLFESVLHLSYKLPIRKWQIRSVSDKTTVQERKVTIQRRFRIETGLIVDVPKAGFGNSNDGNTSRRFFGDPQKAAEITGIDYNLIFRLKIILEVISSGYKVNLKKFADYCWDTAKVYVSLYDWHPMSPTMHKILMHGATVMEKALLPIGLLSEEAAEARNKHFRMYRHHFARKFSRVDCNVDIINRLLLSSDPLLTSLRPKPKSRKLPFSKEAISMLLPPSPGSEDDSDSESETKQTGESDDEPWHFSSSN